MSFNILQILKSTNDYSQDGKVHYVARFQADTESDLPQQEQTNYFIDLGSTCHVVETNADFAIKSNGVWVLQSEITTAYTKAETDALLSGYQPLLTFDSVPTENSQNPVYSGGVYNPIQKAIADLVVDKSGKNRLQNNGISTTVGNEVEFTVNSDGSVTATILQEVTAARSISWYFNCPAGTWLFSTGQNLSGASPSPCFAYLRYSGATIARDYENIPFSMASADTVQCYIQFRTSAVIGETYTFYPMICLPIEYAISDKYIPYT